MTHTPRPAEIDAFDRLSQDFPRVPKRIIASVVKGYLDRSQSLSVAVEASRLRLIDACAAA